MSESQPLRRHTKERTGVVIRAKMTKTVVVEVERLSQHPVYLKVIRKRKRYMVHDEEGKAKTGDAVVIEETRPLSREKRWKVIEVTKKKTSGEA